MSKDKNSLTIYTRLKDYILTNTDISIVEISDILSLK